MLLEADLDAGEAAGDLAGDEGLAAQGRLVVEEDAVAGVDAVGLAVVDGDPVGVELGDGVGGARVERRGLASAGSPGRGRRARRWRPGRTASSSRGRGCGWLRGGVGCRGRRRRRCTRAARRRPGRGTGRRGCRSRRAGPSGRCG